ncbi:MAG: hypothetical protein FWF83_00185 [Clostridiales bacterium]|nr:hypothetical protein [Clostridiales bacterium]
MFVSSAYFSDLLETIGGILALVRDRDDLDDIHKKLMIQKAIEFIDVAVDVLGQTETQSA